MAAPDPKPGPPVSDPPTTTPEPLPWPDACTQMLEKNGYTEPVKLGTGGYSTVFKFKSSQTGRRKEVAIKFIDMDKTNNKYRKILMPRELEALRTLKHAHIVKTLQAMNDGSMHADHFPHRYWIAMELCKTDLYEIASQSPNYQIPEPKARIWMYQVGEAIKYMKSKGWAHRDIKPENILIQAENSAMLTDFSFVRIQQEGTLSTTEICTPVYAAPEVIRVMLKEIDAYDAFASDIWSFACTIFFTCAGQGLVPGTLEWDQMKEIYQAQLLAPAKIKKGRISKVLKEVLTKMTNMIPAQRMTIEQFQDCEWFAVPDEELKWVSESQEAVAASRTRPVTPEPRMRSKKSVMAASPATPASPLPTPSPAAAPVTLTVAEFAVPTVAAPKAVNPPSRSRSKKSMLPDIKPTALPQVVHPLTMPRSPTSPPGPVVLLPPSLKSKPKASTTPKEAAASPDKSGGTVAAPGKRKSREDAGKEAEGHSKKKP